MEPNIIMMKEDILKELYSDIFKRFAIIHIPSGRYQMSTPSASESEGDFRDYVLSLSEKADPGDRARLITNLSLQTLSHRLAAEKKPFCMYYRQNKGSQAVQYEFIYVKLFKKDLILAAFGPVADSIVLEQETSRATNDKVRSQFHFLITSVTENFFEIDVETQQCRKINASQQVEEQELYQDQILWFANHMIVSEERDLYLRNMSFDNLLAALRKNSGLWTSSCNIMYDDGCHSLKITSALVTCKDGKEYIYSYAQDVSEIKRQEEKNRQLLEISQRLLDLSQNDALTGLFNKTAAQKAISDHLADSIFQAPGVLIIIDVDHFKQFNDRYGHMVGDSVLRYVGSTLKEVFRSSDILCRWGGDEFLVFMRNTRNENSIQSRLKRFALQMSHFEEDGKALPISVSIGAAIARKAETMDDLFQRADLALYEVKKNGRDGYQIV